MNTPAKLESLPTTKDFFNDLKSLSGKQTAYGVAKHYGWNANTVRKWEKGHHTFDEDHIEQVAAVLGIDPGYVAFCISIERTKNANLASQMRAWLQAHATAAAVALCAVFIVVSVPSPAHAEGGIAPSSLSLTAIYIMRIAERLRHASRKVRANFPPRFGYLPPVGALAGC